MMQWAELKDWQKALLVAAGVTAAAAGAYFFFLKPTNDPKGPKDPKDPKGSKSPNKGPQPVTSPTAGPPSPTVPDVAAKVAEYKKVGNAAYRSQDYEKALAAYNNALEICPVGQERAILYSNRAAVSMFKREYSQVVKDCTEAIKIKPGYTRAWSRRAQAYEGLQQFERALKDYTVIVLMTELNDQKANVSIERVLSSLAKDKTVQTMKSRVNDAIPPARIVKNYLDNYSEDTFGKHVSKDSLGSLQAAFETDKNGKTLADIVFALIDAEQYAEAFEQSKKAIDLLQEMTMDPENKKLLAGLMNFQSCIKFLCMDYQACETLLTKSLRFDKANHATYLRLAAVRLEVGKTKEALKDYDEAKNLAPNNAEVFYHLAQGQISLGASLMAVGNLDKAISLGCNLYNAYVTSAVIMMQQNNYSGAIELMKQACEKFEGNANAYLYLGEFYYQNGYVMDAQGCFDTALKINPNAGIPYVYEAMAKMNEGKTEEAIAAFNDAISHDPDCDTAYIRLAQLHTQQENYKEAIANYNKAIASSYNASEMVAYFTCKLACEAQQEVLSKYPNLKAHPRPVFQF